jgi:hypothetical protein
MSLITNLSSAQTALPSVNIHPHGHKKGSHVGSADGSTSDGAAQIPTGSGQNLFSTLLQSLQAVIGVQLSAATPPATAANSAAAASSATAASNLPQSPTGAAQLQGAAASRINVKA